MRGERVCGLILKTCIFYIIVSYSLRDIVVHTNGQMKMAIIYTEYAEQEYIHFVKLKIPYSLCCRQFRYEQTYNTLLFYG